MRDIWSSPMCRRTKRGIHRWILSGLSRHQYINDVCMIVCMHFWGRKKKSGIFSASLFSSTLVNVCFGVISWLNTFNIVCRPIDVNKMQVCFGFGKQFLSYWKNFMHSSFSSRKIYLVVCLCTTENYQSKMV